MPPTPTGTAITLLDFACLRAHLQGVPLAKIGEVYLDGHVDVRIIRSRIRAVTDAVKLLAQRQQRPDVRRLAQLRLPAKAGEGRAEPLPSLEDFSAAIGGEGFYTEAELLTMFNEKYAVKADRKVVRDQRLRERQLEALKWAEAQLAAQPVIDDPLVTWFPAHWAARLRKAGISTLAMLVDRINEHGARWWEDIPHLGERSARQIGAFLTTHHVSLGGRLRLDALVPRRQKQTVALIKARPPEAGIVPLESVRCPKELDGSNGLNRNRRDRSLIDAENDLAAVQAWLAQYESSKNTYRSYRRDAERLLLWSVFEARKPLSSLSVEDCIAYRAFLESDKTGTRWAGTRGAERWSPAWRPFEAGILSPGSVDQAMMVAGHLFNWLVEQCYLAGNPMKAVPSARRTRLATEEGRQAMKARAREQGERSRGFSVRLWRLVTSVLAAQPDDATWARARLVLHWAQRTGLRAREMIESQVRDLVRIEDEETGETFMVLSVAGKGDKYREVPVPSDLLSLLSAHFRHRGLPEQTHDNDPDTYLIGRTSLTPYWQGAKLVTPDPKSGISYEMLYRIVTGTFEKILAAAGQLSDQDARQLASASTHWLRHCFGTQQRRQGVDLRIIQETLGHSAAGTTAHYSQISVLERAKALAPPGAVDAGSADHTTRENTG